jgi:hypothetical protein
VVSLEKEKKGKRILKIRIKVGGSKNEQVDGEEEEEDPVSKAREDDSPTPFLPVR